MMQALPRPYRHLLWIVLAFLVTWSGLFALSTAYPLDIYAGGSFSFGVILVVSMMGLGMSFLQLVGLWLVFGPGRYLYRILWSVLACLVGMGGMLVTMIVESWGDPNALGFELNWATGVLLLFPFFFLLLQLPSAMVRFLFGWRLHWGDAPPTNRPLSISDLLTITALIAASVASRSWVNFDMRDGPNIEASLGIGILWVPALLLFALPILYFVLTPWTGELARPGWKGVGLAIYVALIPVTLFALSTGFIGGGWEASIYIVCLIFALVSSLLISLGISRSVGFRLWTRWSKRAFERAHRLGQSDTGQQARVVDPLEFDDPT